MRDKWEKMKRTGEAATKRICLAFQFVADFKGESFTARTQNFVISCALIELAGIERKKIERVICELMMKGYSTKWTLYHSKRAKIKEKTNTKPKQRD